MGTLTQETPKPMMPVRGKPILETIITGLRDSGGVHDFFIVIGYRGEVIESYFGDGSKFGVQITYGRQVVQDGTGKAPELAKAWIGNDPFVFSYGDILVPGEEYAGLIQGFDVDGLIALKAGQDLKHGGAVLLNDEGFMIDLVEKGKFEVPPPNAHFNAGIYVLTPSIFEHTAKIEKSPRGEYEFTDALKRWQKHGAKIRGHFLKLDWVDVRDPEILARLNRNN